MTRSDSRQPVVGSIEFSWRSFPLRGRTLRTLVTVFLVVVGVGVAVGWGVTGPLDGSVGTFDRGVASSLAAGRTPTWDGWTDAGSMSADSLVKIPAVIVLSALFLWRWRRWNEAALLAGALALESAAFVTISMLVGRERPAVQQLDSIPPTDSFPSGHAAAALAFYGALAIIVFWHTGWRVLRLFATIGAVTMPLVVAASRVYRGMHHVSDVVAGLVLGGVSLWVLWTLTRPEGSTDRRR